MFIAFTTYLLICLGTFIENIRFASLFSIMVCL